MKRDWCPISEMDLYTVFSMESWKDWQRNVLPL